MQATIRLRAPLLALTLAACGTEPVFTAYDVTIVSPSGPEGAALLELDGSFADAFTVNSDRVFTHAGGGVTRVVLVKHVPGDLTFTLVLDAPDPPPQARILQVADGANQLRAFLDGYRVEFTGIEQ